MANTMTDAERIEELVYRLRDIDILRMEALDGMMEARAIIDLFLQGKVDENRLKELKDSLAKKIHEPCISLEKTEWGYKEAVERVSFGIQLSKGKADVILVGDKVQDSEGHIGEVLSVYRAKEDFLNYYVDLYIRVQMEGETEPTNIKLTEVKKVE